MVSLSHRMRSMTTIFFLCLRRYESPGISQNTFLKILIFSVAKNPTSLNPFMEEAVII